MSANGRLRERARRTRFGTRGVAAATGADQRRSRVPVAEAAGGAPPSEGVVRVLTRRHRPRVVLGIRDVAFHQEVLDFLERNPNVVVAGGAADTERLTRLLTGVRFDALVVCPETARDLRHPAARAHTGRTIVISEEMSVPVLRDAVDVGASAVLEWPEERADLVEILTTGGEAHVEPGDRRAHVVAVRGVRGGVGATLVTTHLAAAFADSGARTVIVDVSEFGDLAVSLGLAGERRIRSLADLREVADELSPEHVERALHQTPRGFAVLLGQATSTAEVDVPAGVAAGAIALLAGGFDVVLLHLSRTPSETADAALRLADDVVLVCGDDLLSTHGLARAVRDVGRLKPPSRIVLVVNGVRRARHTREALAGATGVARTARVRFDRRLARAHESGRIIRGRSRRGAADVRALASLVRGTASERQA